MKHLDEYTERQKQISPSPFLFAKTMSRLENSRTRTAPAMFWQSVAVAAGMTVVVLLGIAIGSGYRPVSYLPINDNQIENFSILASDDNQ